MQVSPVDGPGPSQPTSTVTTASSGGFEAALGEVEQRSAARDLLAAMPPPIAYQILHPPTDGSPPVPGMHEMFVAVQDGTHVPSERELRAPFWRALDTAARTFDSPDEMWATMRTMLADRQSITTALARPATAAPTEATPAAAGPATGSPATTAPAPAATPIVEAATPADADTPESSEDSAALSALGGDLPAAQLDWWEWVLQYVLVGNSGQD